MPPVLPTNVHETTHKELHKSKTKTKNEGSRVSVMPLQTGQKKLFGQTNILENDLNTCSTDLALGTSDSAIPGQGCLGFARYAKGYAFKTPPTPFESRKRHKVDSVSDLKLGYSPNSLFLSLSSYGSSENVESPTSGNSVRCENGQFSCSTPPDLTLSISSTSSTPESFLTNSATTLKNTPHVDNLCLYTPSQSQIRSAGSENMKQSLGSSVHRSQPTLGRSLDYMFNSEWNPNVIKGYKSSSITSSSNVNMGTGC